MKKTIVCLNIERHKICQQSFPTYCMSSTSVTGQSQQNYLTNIKFYSVLMLYSAVLSLSFIVWHNFCLKPNRTCSIVHSISWPFVILFWINSRFAKTWKTLCSKVPSPKLHSYRGPQISFHIIISNSSTYPTQKCHLEHRSYLHDMLIS